MDVESVADELYELPPEQFVSLRTVREKEARATGDRELAARIRRLPKPNQVAALANLLARRASEEVEPLLALGAELRETEAGLTGERLREFTRQKRQLVGTLVQRARALAAEEGRKASEETLRGLETTLNAALADDEAAAAFRSGRLSTGLAHSGFGPAPAGLASVTPLRPGTADRGASAATPFGSQPARRAGSSKDERRAAAERGLAAAQRSEQAAAAACSEAEATADAAELALAAAEDDVERLRESLAQAERSASQAAGERRRTRKELERAQRKAERATHARQEAQARLQAT